MDSEYGHACFTFTGLNIVEEALPVSSFNYLNSRRQIAEPEEVHFTFSMRSTISTIHSTGMVLILAAVAVLGAEGATVWDLNHRARAQFWRTVAPDMHYKSSSTAPWHWNYFRPLPFSCSCRKRFCIG
ncbi:hypothetical protein ACJX0J_034862 [Zea mays]